MTDFSRQADWFRDPKHVLFVLARYKFVAKMLAGMDEVLEIGAGDGWASEVVRREVKGLTCTDIAPAGEVIQHDILSAPYTVAGYNGVYSLDVIEHIAPKDTEKFLSHLAYSLVPRGVCIIGTPSLESQQYASELSRQHHVNCMTAKQLQTVMRGHFDPVFSFGMNDETLHTGHESMRHYLFAIGVRNAL